MCCYYHEVAGLIPTVVRLTFQPTRCGYTLRVTSKTIYSSEYITSKCTHKKVLFDVGTTLIHMLPLPYAKPTVTQLFMKFVSIILANLAIFAPVQATTTFFKSICVKPFFLMETNRIFFLWNNLSSIICNSLSVSSFTVVPIEVFLKY